MGRESSPYIVGDYWLDKRRDGKSPVWQIASYDPATRSISYRSTKRRDVEDAKAVILAYVDKERAKGTQTPNDARVIPLLVLYWEEHGSKVVSPDQIGSSIRAWIGFFMQDKAGVNVTVAQLDMALFTRFQAWRMGPHGYDVPWQGKDYRHTSKGVSGEAVKRNQEDFRAALNHATRYGRLAFVPKVPSVALALRSPPRDLVLSIKQLGAIMGYARHEPGLWRWLALMAGTLSRPEAALAFDPARQWDAERGLIDLHPPEWPRTKKRNPVVKAIPALAYILAVWKDDPAPAPASRKRAWSTLRRTLELPAKAVPKTIRHSIATELRSRGVHKELIETQLGHSFGNRTTEVYAKYDPAFMGNLPDVLATIFAEIMDEANKWSAVHLLSKVGNNRRMIVDKKDMKEQIN